MYVGFYDKLFNTSALSLKIVGWYKTHTHWYKSWAVSNRFIWELFKYFNCKTNVFKELNKTNIDLK